VEEGEVPGHDSGACATPPADPTSRGSAGQTAGTPRSRVPQDDGAVVARGEDRAVAGRKRDALHLGRMRAKGLQTTRQALLWWRQRARGEAALGRCKTRARGAGTSRRDRIARNTQAQIRVSDKCRKRQRARHRGAVQKRVDESVLALSWGPRYLLGKRCCWLVRSQTKRGKETAQRGGGGQRAGAREWRGGARRLRTRWGGREGRARTGRNLAGDVDIPDTNGLVEAAAEKQAVAFVEVQAADRTWVPGDGSSTHARMQCKRAHDSEE